MTKPQLVGGDATRGRSYDSIPSRDYHPGSELPPPEWGGVGRLRACDPIAHTARQGSLLGAILRGRSERIGGDGGGGANVGATGLRGVRDRVPARRAALSLQLRRLTDGRAAARGSARHRLARTLRQPPR